jgi:hypothetical protein
MTGSSRQELLTLLFSLFLLSRLQVWHPKFSYSDNGLAGFKKFEIQGALVWPIVRGSLLSLLAVNPLGGLGGPKGCRETTSGGKSPDPKEQRQGQSHLIRAHLSKGETHTSDFNMERGRWAPRSALFIITFIFFLKNNLYSQTAAHVTHVTVEQNTSQRSLRRLPGGWKKRHAPPSQAYQ